MKDFRTATACCRIFGLKTTAVEVCHARLATFLVASVSLTTISVIHYYCFKVSVGVSSAI